MTLAPRLVAATVVLVLAGSPVMASACAAWCPPGAAHGETATGGVGARSEPAPSSTACAAPHRHDAPGTPADAGARITSLAAPTVCCSAPGLETGRVTQALHAAPVLAPPPAMASAHGLRAAPRRARSDSPPRPAATRVPRVLVLRI